MYNYNKNVNQIIHLSLRAPVAVHKCHHMSMIITKRANLTIQFKTKKLEIVCKQKAVCHCHCQLVWPPYQNHATHRDWRLSYPSPGSTKLSRCSFLALRAPRHPCEIYRKDFLDEFVSSLFASYEKSHRQAWQVVRNPSHRRAWQAVRYHYKRDV